jgi:hypothetical protein
MIRYDMPLDAGRVACMTKTYLEARNMQHFLVENGGQFEVSGTWCLDILREDYSRRKCTTQAAKLPHAWEASHCTGVPLPQSPR